jgi:hypothetical protein
MTGGWRFNLVLASGRAGGSYHWSYEVSRTISWSQPESRFAGWMDGWARIILHADLLQVRHRAFVPDVGSNFLLIPLSLVIVFRSVSSRNASDLLLDERRSISSESRRHAPSTISKVMVCDP